VTIRVRSRHRTTYSQGSIECLDFQDHHQLKNKYTKILLNLFCDSYFEKENKFLGQNLNLRFS